MCRRYQQVHIKPPNNPKIKQLKYSILCSQTGKKVLHICERSKSQVTLVIFPRIDTLMEINSNADRNNVDVACFIKSRSAYQGQENWAR